MSKSVYNTLIFSTLLTSHSNSSPFGYIYVTIVEEAFFFFKIFVNNEFWSVNDTKLILLRSFICPILSQSQIRPLTSCFDRKS